MKAFINKKYIMVLFFLIILTPFIFILGSGTHKKMPIAKNGILDLTNWDFQKDEVVRLDGEWEFYWNQLLTYDDFHNEKQNESSAYIHVPSVWNDKKLPGEGYATYRLKIKTNDQEVLKGLKILNLSTAYKLMVNRETIASNGVIGKNRKTAVPEFKPQAVAFKNDSKEFEIIIQISNFTYSRGGLWYPIYLGTDQQIRRMKENNSRKELFLFGALLIMTVYHMAIFWLQKKNKSALYFALTLFAAALRIPVTGEYFIISIIPAIDIKWMVFIEYITIYLGPTAWLAFVHELYPEESSKKIVKVSVCIALMLTIFTMIAHIRVYTRFLIFYEILIASMVGYTLFSNFLVVYRKKEGAELLLVGTIILLFTFINDCLYHWNMIESKPGGMFGFAAFILIFIQAYILAERFSNAFDEVEKLSEKMISLNKLKDEFLANTSHELRTPLHGIISITESVLQDIDEKLSPKQRGNLSLVVSSGRRLANLVNDILDYSRLKHGDIRLHKRSIDIRQIVQGILDEQRYLIENDQVILINGISDKIPLIYADEDRLTQILYNLVGNAVKFTNEGEIRVSAVENNGMVEISVEDTGMGIPQDKIEDIFKSFEQVDTSITRRTGGTGLGLSITKNLVEIQGGKIWATSVFGKGSKFTFSMPVSHHRKGTVEYNRTVKSFQGHNQLYSQFLKDPVVFEGEGEFTILIVDDDFINLQSIVNILSTEKYSIVAVTNGMKALDVISKNKKIDMVILDIMLPKISGFQVCRRIREKYSLYDLPVLMLTAQNNSQAILTGFKSGANDFLPKPFETSELKARVKTLLELKKSVQYAINAEMAFLQAQIKPHFLYNALNTIISLCYSEPDKAGELLSELSNYLRGSFDFSNTNKFVSIKKEIEFVQSYLAIEKARFEEKINCEYVLNAPLDFMIPTLILQPIVENAVKHGILKRDGGGNIKISVTTEDEWIIMKVEDDGVGISKEKLSRILDENDHDKSVGLKNINKRMNRIYGYGIEIESEFEKGTMVSIKIPHKRGEISA